MGTHLVGNKSATAFVVNAPVEGRAVGLAVDEDSANDVTVECAPDARGAAADEHLQRSAFQLVRSTAG